jgi:hypothetical protein
VTAVLAATALAVAVGIPTGLLPTPLYARMTPVLWWNYPVWVVSAVLGGVTVATYIRRPGYSTARNGLAAASTGGLVAAFAVGCPLCNKLAVAAVGASGVMSVWAPAQPVMGAFAVLGLGWALRRRLTSAYACPAAHVPPTRREGPTTTEGDVYCLVGTGAAMLELPRLPTGSPTPS